MDTCIIVPPTHYDVCVYFYHNVWSRAMTHVYF